MSNLARPLNFSEAWRRLDSAEPPCDPQFALTPLWIAADSLGAVLCLFARPNGLEEYMPLIWSCPGRLFHRAIGVDFGKKRIFLVNKYATCCTSPAFHGCKLLNLKTRGLAPGLHIKRCVSNTEVRDIGQTSARGIDRVFVLDC